ncbi:MAG: hypothetical protein MZU84_07360 [Sphingobacterium sp.]|nr:hypothetical protein [Sphingobacterium sp.]
MSLDPFQTALVVADESRGGGSIVLAVTPYLKKLGVPSRCRIHDLPTNVDIIFAKPRLHKYLEYSTKIVEIYLRYISEEDIYVYSVDEVFMDFTNYLDYYKTDIVTLAKRIKQAIYEETKVHSSCGIGPNMLMAKLALGSRKQEDARLRLRNGTTKTFRPNFGRSSRYPRCGASGPKHGSPAQPHGALQDRRHRPLRRREAQAPLRRLGRGTLLPHPRHRHEHFAGQGQDAHRRQILRHRPGAVPRLLRTRRLPDHHRDGRRRHAVVCAPRRRRRGRSIWASATARRPAAASRGRSPCRSPSRPNPPSTRACLHLFHEHYEGEPIRRVNIALTGLAPQAEYQFSMFENVEQVVKEQQLFAAIDEVKDRFGKNAVNRASSETKASTIKDRNKMIGGHYA